MKFINLLKKELSELINKQMIFSLIFTIAIFFIMGNVMESATSEIVEEAKSNKLSICNMDDSDIVKEMIDSFKENGSEINLVTVEGDNYASAFKNHKKLKGFVVIPKGFGEAVEKGEKPEVYSVSKVQGAAAFSNMTSGPENTLSSVTLFVSQKLADQKGVSKEQLLTIEDPLTVTEHTVVADKSAQVSMGSIVTKLMMQNMVLPIIIVLLIMMTSQSLISSISNEKIDKTLETLLSTPVSRGSVITAKMLAAAIVALLNAGVMMVGFTSYTAGMMGSMTSDITSAIPQDAAESAKGALSGIMSSGEALKQLGLQLGAFDYVLIGVQLFITIMICLALSIILGALVNDSKSAQTMILPIVMMVMIPWMITMFTDVNSLPTAAKYVIYAIPFTHTFTAMSNLMFGNTTEFWLGLGYQIIVFAVVMFFALKLFKSDKILTISLNLGQKSKFKKSRKTTED
ncbi:ABC transporter permease [Ruminococcus flavefaciens]|jgi:ABC-2 type transport system permease protein|uniref:ABC transporter permease n=1 Tax=Ruminococcus flavefaciens TaxID=1265 RepID=UPI0025F54386|nr:ABC transporter permease [Ruminococcus flavefaciens]